MVFHGIEILQVEILQAHPTIAEKVHLYFLFIYDFLIFFIYDDHFNLPHDVVHNSRRFLLVS